MTTPIHFDFLHVFPAAVLAFEDLHARLPNPLLDALSFSMT